MTARSLRRPPPNPVRRGRTATKPTVAARTIDLRRSLKHLYGASSKAVQVVDVPTLSYLMIDGAGDPDTSVEFRQAMEALYGTAYTLKAMLRKSAGLAFSVMPLEGLWWSNDAAETWQGDRRNWRWTLMLPQPDVVTQQHFEAAREAVAARKSFPALPRLRLEQFAEGRAAQLLHLGPYAEERPSIARLHAFIAEQGGTPKGKHHEIYLGDPRRAAPTRLRTILRQPFA